MNEIAKIFLAAATQVEQRVNGCGWSCVHLKNAGASVTLREAYSSLFRPPEELAKEQGDAWGAAWSDQEIPRADDPIADQCRVLALCFAAAMAETGDLQCG